MKKTFTLLIALFALCVSTWATVSQQQIGSFYYELDDENHTATLIKLPGSSDWASYEVSGDITIPGKVNYSSADYTVTTIAEKAFVNTDITSVIIEEGVMFVGGSAFSNCTLLTTATLPSTILSLGSQAFAWSDLSTFTIKAARPATLSYDPFDYVTTLEHIYVPSANVNAYKAASGWSTHASLIERIPPTFTVTWDNSIINQISLSCANVNDVATSSEMNGITASIKKTSESGSNCLFSGFEIWISNRCGELTFESSVGDITGIVIYCGSQVWNYSDLSSDWTYDNDAKTFTWSGTASDKVSISGYIDCMVASIKFTIANPEPASAPTLVTWDETKCQSVDIWGGDISSSSKKIDNITVIANAPAEGDYSHFNPDGTISLSNGGTLTFASASGKFTRIVISCTAYNFDHPEDLASGSGWLYSNNILYWSGDAAAAVVLACKSSSSVYFRDVKSSDFTVVEDAAPVDPTPATITSTVIWDQTDVESIDARPDNPYVGVPGYQILKGISVTANAPQSGDNCHFMTAYNNTSISAENGGTVSFAPLAGKLTKIVITCTGYANYSDLSSAWTWNESTKELTWSGNATQSVALACEGSNGYIFFGNIYSIEYTVVTEEAPANPFIIWEQRQVNHVELNSYTKDYHDVAPVIRNIIATLTRTNSNVGNCLFDGGQIAISGCGELEFKSIVGELSSIVITCSSVTSASDLSTDWTYNSGAKTITWEGTAAEEVTLSGNIDCNVTSIKFFYTPADAPRLGEQFQGIYDQLYQITGAQTAMMPVQQITHTLQVPETVDYEGVTYYVTEIADNAFKNNKLPNAYIGANVGRIGAHALEGCTIMSDISIYSHVVDEIGEQAFKDCKLMQIFECYTKQPPVLGSNAFDGDGRINHILVQYDTEDAYKNADGWSNLADKVEEMSNAPYIGEIFFFNNQKTVNLYQVLALPDYFSSTNGQAKVVPYTAEVNAIYPRTLESTLVVPEEVSYVAGMKYSVTGVGANAYKNCTEVQVVLFPEGVTSIEAGAFAGCTEVMNVFFVWKDPTIVTWADADKGLEFATAASGKTKIIVPKDKLAEYQVWAPAWASCMVAGEIEDVEATQDPNSYGTSARYYRTFYDSTKDYMLPPSVWAHAGYVRGNEFILRPVAFDGEILPKGTAVVLESETAEYRLIAMENSSVPAYTGPNDLIGLDAARTVDFVVDSLNITADQIYVLNRRATVGGELQVGMGMYRYTGTTLGAKKAFMVLRNPVETGTSDDQPAPGRFLFRHEDTATSFENVQTDNDLCTKILRDGQLIIIRDGKEYNAQGMIIK